MDLSLFLTILGLVLTIIFGLLSIDLFKRKKSPGRITLVKQSEIGLFNNIAKNFNEISIKYKGENISENVIYIKACLINDGDIDIEGNKVEKTINLHLKNNLKWIKVIVSKNSNDLISVPEVTNSQLDLKFNFGLIRKKEFFQFEALIETTNPKLEADDIYDYIEISHRIANTQKISTVSLLNEEQIKRKKKRIKSLSLNFGSYLIILLLTLLLQIFYFKSAPIYYKDLYTNIYKAKATSELNIELENIKTEDTKIISLKEFQNNNYKPLIPNQTFWEKLSSAKYLVPFVIIIILSFVGLEYYELRKSNKINDIINSETKKK